MKFLLGLLFVLFAIYALYLIFSSDKTAPEYRQIPAENTAAEVEHIAHEAVAHKTGPPPLDEDTTAKEGGGMLAGAKEYVVSAIKKYEEIFDAERSSGKDESKKKRPYEMKHEESVNENNNQALLIYEEILGLEDSGRN
jgi:hypothetical protein